MGGVGLMPRDVPMVGQDGGWDVGRCVVAMCVGMV